jgi:hypothetical protein
MGEKGNVADVRSAGGHVASAAQAATRPQDLGVGGQPLSGAAPPPVSGGGGGGGLLSDLAEKAGDKAIDTGLGQAGSSGIVGGKRDEDDDES